MIKWLRKIFKDAPMNCGECGQAKSSWGMGGHILCNDCYKEMLERPKQKDTKELGVAKAKEILKINCKACREQHSCAFKWKEKTFGLQFALATGTSLKAWGEACSDPKHREVDKSKEEKQVYKCGLFECAFVADCQEDVVKHRKGEYFNKCQAYATLACEYCSSFISGNVPWRFFVLSQCKCKFHWNNNIPKNKPECKCIKKPPSMRNIFGLGASVSVFNGVILPHIIDKSNCELHREKKKEMSLEHGKRYKRRDGKITGKIIATPHDPNFAFFDAAHMCSYLPNGSWLDQEDYRDIIEEYVETEQKKDCQHKWYLELEKPLECELCHVKFRDICGKLFSERYAEQKEKTEIKLNMVTFLCACRVSKVIHSENNFLGYELDKSACYVHKNDVTPEKECAQEEKTQYKVKYRVYDADTDFDGDIVELRLVEGNGNVCLEAHQNGARSTLLFFYADGVIERVAGVNKNFGFWLNNEGQVKIDD